MQDAYLLFGLGLLFSVIGFLIAFILHGIKGEIREVNTKLDNIEHDLNTKVTVLERRYQDKLSNIEGRLAAIEGRCRAHHE